MKKFIDDVIVNSEPYKNEETKLIESGLKNK